MKLGIKFFLILGLIILGLAGYGYLKSIPNVENQQDSPKIEISPKFFDFGEMEFGRVAEYSFKVKNAGSGVLEIKRVATSCACTTAKITEGKLEPGETAGLLVSYDTAAMGRSSHGMGKQERIIYIKSSDPVNPQVEVMIYADVK